MISFILCLCKILYNLYVSFVTVVQQQRNSVMSVVGNPAMSGFGLPSLSLSAFSFEGVVNTIKAQVSDLLFMLFSVLRQDDLTTNLISKISNSQVICVLPFLHSICYPHFLNHMAGASEDFQSPDCCYTSDGITFVM